MICLAAPYGVQSTALEQDGGLLYEILHRGCFAACLATGLSVPLVRGHSRAGRKRADWTIAQIKPFETERGLWFHFDGELPPDFTGFSLEFLPIRFRRIGNAAFLLQEGQLKRIALLQKPDVPAYPSTFSYVKGSIHAYSH